MKIIGNTVGTTTPKPNFKQTDPKRGDYIKNKPSLKALAEKDVADKGDLATDVQASLDKADAAVLSIEQALTEEQKLQARANMGAASQTIVGELETALEGKADSATTLTGYGITDAYSKTDIDNMVLITVSDIDTICETTIQVASDSG